MIFPAAGSCEVRERVSPTVATAEINSVLRASIRSWAEMPALWMRSNALMPSHSAGAAKPSVTGINPMTSAMRQEVGEANVEALVRHVSAISGEQIPDFSHLAEDGDASFYDLKHIRPSVATDILGKILAPKSL